MKTSFAYLAMACLVGAGTAAIADEPARAAPPIRKLQLPADRPLAQGPAWFVDPASGDDAAEGKEKSPWRTINHALKRLKSGDTLYLRGGTYYENVYCAVAGRKDAPITIRAYPNEQAILDGGMREFAEHPTAAWEPVADGAPGEFRSVRSFMNIRDVVGLFGDTHHGLQTYWHIEDLRADNEQWLDDPAEKQMVLPIYCGPGLWYDKESGRIHIRLAHTHNRQPQVPNYESETDPRKVPLVIAAFNSVPLFVDQGMHVRFQDLVIRGGGHNSVVLQFGVGVEFDNITIFAGTYGVRARSTGPLRMVDSAIHGIIPPWAWRDENALYTYTPDTYDPFVPSPEPTNRRNIARLPTHALLVTEGSYEFEVFYYPHNHDWDVSQCEFTDGHDGVYLSGRNIRFHHNWVTNIQDDAIYLSSPSLYFNDQLHVYQNLITHSLSAFGFHKRGGPNGSIFLYRNIVDLRRGIQMSRPGTRRPDGLLLSANIFLTHGREFLGIESLYFYQNTFVAPTRGFAQNLNASTTATTVRRVFNNLLVYLKGSPTPRAGGRANATEHDVIMDGNLHWSPGDKPLDESFLRFVRTSPSSQANQARYPPGWEANSIVADPRFIKFDRDPDGLCDYRLQDDSPTRGQGIVLPGELEDPLRPADGARPDSALPTNAKAPQFGRHGRVTFPIRGDGTH